jgi:hypothetical protein
VEIKKRSPHYHRLDDYEQRFHLSMAEKLSKLSGPRHAYMLIEIDTRRVTWKFINVDMVEWSTHYSKPYPCL